MTRTISKCAVLALVVAACTTADAAPAAGHKRAPPPKIVRTWSLLTNSVPPYDPTTCKLGDVSSVVRIHVNLAKLLLKTPCPECLRSATPDTSTERAMPGTEGDFTQTTPVKVGTKDWMTPIDVNLYGKWLAASHGSHQGQNKPILLEVILDDPTLTFLYPSSGNQNTTDSSRAISPDNTAYDEHMFTCRQPIATDDKGLPVVRFRVNDVSTWPGGLNIGVIGYNAKDGTVTGLPIYIDPHIGNNG